MSQQLVKKGSDGRYSNVMPNSWIEAIKDKGTGQTLVEILQGFNMYFLPYNGNTSATRCLVPMILRKKGLWITYVKYDGNVYTEWYAASDIDDKSWGDSSNWRIGNNTLVGDITISSNGNWVINGTETEFKAVGEKGNTPLLRVANNKLQVSYNLGETYLDVTNNPVYTKFRWLATSGDTQANNVGRIQASTDEGKTWTNMSNDFINNLHISKYIGANESLPTSGIAEGTIYAKGPTYAIDDGSNSNPIYRLWVYAWKGNTLAWQDNGEFTSVAAGVVQETGDSETKVMSQKAVTNKLTELGVYVKNPEFVEVHSDAEDKVLYGVKANGDFYFGAGVPRQVQNEIERKVDKVEGKGLSTNDYTSEDKEIVDTQELVENPEFLQVITDNSNKILEGTTAEGKKQINIPIDTPSATVEHIDNPEWMEVKTDKDGSILEGIRKNGKKYIADLEGYTKGVQTSASSNKMYPIKDDTIGYVDGSYYVIPNIGKVNQRRFKLKYKWAKNLCIQNDSNVILNIKGKSGNYTFTLNQTAPSNTKLFPQVINTDIQPGRENIYNVDYPMAAMDSSLVIKKNNVTISTINLDNIRFRNLTKYNPAMSIQYIKKPDDILTDLLDLRLYITSSGNNICDNLTIKKGSTILFTYQFDVTKLFYDTYMDLKTSIESIEGYNFDVVFYDIERMTVADIVPTKTNGLPFVSAYSKNLLNNGEILYGAFPVFVETQDKSIHDLQIVEFDGHLNVYLDEGQLLRVTEDEVSEISIHRGIISIVSTGQDDTDSSYSIPTIYEITGHGFANRPFGGRWDTQNLNQQVGYFTHLKKRFEDNGYVNISMKEAARHYTDGYPVPDKCFFIDLDDFPYITDTYKGVPTKALDWDNEDGMRLMEIWKSTGIKLTFTQEFSRDQELWERLTYGEATNEVKVSDVQAMLSLTTSNVATGYIVKTLDNGKEYVVIDSSKLGTMDAFSEIDENRLCALLTNDEIIRIRNMMKNYDWNVNIHSLLCPASVGEYKAPGNMNFDEWKSAIRTTIKWYERMYENVPMRHNMSATGQNSPYFERLYACYGIPVTGCDSPSGNGEVPHQISDYPTFNKLTFSVYRPQGILYNDYDFE